MTRILLAIIIATAGLMSCAKKPLSTVQPESPAYEDVATGPLEEFVTQVYFDFNADTLADPTVLQPAIAFLLANPAYALHVDGYADPVGDSAYNAALSQRRANNVFTFITDAAPPRMGLSIGHGEAEERTVIVRAVP